jgi:hypothetical protein
MEGSNSRRTFGTTAGYHYLLIAARALAQDTSH